MSLFEDIENHLKDAMRARQKERLLALRNIKSHLKNKIIEAKRELKDSEIIQELSTLAKQRRESIEAYDKAGRDDLSAKESAELGVIQEFLPAALSDDELVALVKQAIADTGAAGPRDMGKVMKTLKPQVTGRADGKVVSERVKSLLAE